MNKNLLIVVGVTILIGGLILLNRSPQKQISDLKKAEKKLTKDLGLKEGKPKAPIYPSSKIDFDKCGEDAYYIEEKSADFVKNYCRFLRDKGWKLVHLDYSNCEDIKSSGGGYNYEKGEEKIAISVIRYGQDATCYWILARK